jgi:hypothetical protein
MSIELTMLFDESGTPTLKNDRESDFFLGVTLTYPTELENDLFLVDPGLFNLESKTPKKNSKIKLSKIESIGEYILNQSILWCICYLDLSSEEFQEVAATYHDYYNCIRSTIRTVRDRPVAQILYNQLISDSVFYSIQHSFESSPTDLDFNIFLDNWSHPVDDEKIVLELTPQSMTKRSNEILEKFNIHHEIRINNFTPLSDDSAKKRIIDIATSAASRAFLSSDDEKYSAVINEIITNGNRKSVHLRDITSTTIDFFREFINRTAKEGL